MVSMTIIRILSIVFLLIKANGHGQSTGAYLHDDDITGGNKANWMSVVTGSTKLSVLSLPGTHVSMALQGGDIAETQSLSLTKQLDAGVRVLDIRCRHINNAFAIHHGSVYQQKMLNDVMNELTSWLSSHSTETVLAIFKLNEHTATGNTRTEEATFETYFQSYSNYIWSTFATNNWAPVPSISEVRGQIVIFQNFASSAKKYGLDYKDHDVFDIQTNYDIGSNWGLYDKWNKIKSKVSQARNGKSTSKFHMNYLSASGGSFPYFVASGHSSSGTGASRLSTGKTTAWEPNAYPNFPRTACSLGCTILFEGSNILFYEHYGNPIYDFVGIIMIDFPGKALLDTIVDKNMQYDQCNYQCYLHRYVDLQNAFGNDLNSARSHFRSSGLSDGRDCTCDGSGQCNWGCYLENYSDLQHAFGDDLNAAKNHYSSYGENEGRTCQCNSAVVLPHINNDFNYSKYSFVIVALYVLCFGLYYYRMKSVTAMNHVWNDTYSHTCKMTLAVILVNSDIPCNV